MGEAEMEHAARISLACRGLTKTRFWKDLPSGDGGKLGVLAAKTLLRSVLTVESTKGLRGQSRPFLAGTSTSTLPLCGVLGWTSCLRHQFGDIQHDAMKAYAIWARCKLMLCCRHRKDSGVRCGPCIIWKALTRTLICSTRRATDYTRASPRSTPYVGHRLGYSLVSR